jgi:hypothetical protein
MSHMGRVFFTKLHSALVRSYGRVYLKIVMRHWISNEGSGFYMCICVPNLHVYKIRSYQEKDMHQRPIFQVGKVILYSLCFILIIAI